MRILYVAFAPIYPARSGGKVRMAGVAESLRRYGHEVTVIDPEMFAERPDRPSWRHFAGVGPRLGRVRMTADLVGEIRRCDFDLLMLSISYLGPFVPSVEDLGKPVVVEFANIERDRFAAIARESDGVHRWSARLESLKARWWEPRVAKRATLCVACSESEAATLRSWGAETVLVEHAADVVSQVSTSDSHEVLYLATGGHAPNDAGGRWLLEQVWPKVVDALPAARLRIVGRGTSRTYGGVTDPSVTVVGEVDDLAAEIERAALAVSPVSSGAGAQLKVVTVLAHSRTMVVTPYSMRSVPQTARRLVREADLAPEFADAIVRGLTAVDSRRDVEAELRSLDLSWHSAVAELARRLQQVGEDRRT